MVKVTDRYEVDSEQLEETYTTVFNLLDKIFGHDQEEDPNVEFILINRERCQGMHFMPLPYAHKEEVSLERILDIALTNLMMATEQVRVLQSIRVHQRISGESKG